MKGYAAGIRKRGCRIEGLVKRLTAVRTIVATLLFAVLTLPAQAQAALPIPDGP